MTYEDSVQLAQDQTLKAEQQAMRPNERADPETSSPLHVTQVGSGYSEGSHPESSRHSGTQEVGNGVVLSEGRPPAAGTQASEGDPPTSLDLPLTDYIRLAAEKNAEALRTDSRWRGPAWTFCRYMKSRPEFSGLDSRQATDRLDDLLGRMFPEAEDPWVELLGDEDSQGHGNDPFEHFAESWDAVENELGEAPLEKALRRAEEHPLVLEAYRSKRWEGYRRFLSICRWLQEIRGDKAIIVPVRKFGTLLGVEPTSVSRYRKWAQRDDYLVLVKEHEGRGKATEFRFVLEALNSGMDTEEQAADGEWGEVE